MVRLLAEFAIHFKKFFKTQNNEGRKNQVWNKLNQINLMIRRFRKITLYICQ